MTKKMVVFAAVFLFVLIVSFSAAAKSYTSAQIEKFVLSTPRAVENSTSTLARYLTKPFDNDYDKARAIAFWIASHIYYDDYLYNGTKNKETYLRKTYQKQTPAKLLRSRVGLCVDYAALFQEMCRKAGISATTIKGYAYPARAAFSPAIRNNYGHVWNYFLFKGKKIYVDTTFMAGGSLGADKYPNSAKHKNALYNFKKKNKETCVTASVNSYYFDFNYKDEETVYSKTHRER